MSSSASAQAPHDVREAVQALLNDRRLARYWHFDTQPTRVPLKLANRSGVTFELDAVTADGRPTTLAQAGRDAFEIRSVSGSGGAVVLGFGYGPEGIQGRATVKGAAGNWTVETVEITER